jgi:hypothetical protein
MLVRAISSLVELPVLTDRADDSVRFSKADGQLPQPWNRRAFHLPPSGILQVK